MLATGSTASGVFSCANPSVGPAAWEPAISNGGLTYDASSGRYTFVWKTSKSWAGSCRRLTLKLDDGTTHWADFKFTK